MALPLFIAGIAVGGLAVVAFNNKEKIAEKLKDGAEKVKEFGLEKLEQAEKFAQEVKKGVETKKASKTAAKPRNKKAKPTKKETKDAS